ncbi:MAG: hypothetical protein ACXABY_00620 [Candidatus Thorarchaeota archaeon]|jgi:hypothetical protein
MTAAEVFDNFDGTSGEFLDACKLMIEIFGVEPWADSTVARRDQMELIRRAPYGWTPIRDRSGLTFMGPEKFSSKKYMPAKLEVYPQQNEFMARLVPSISYERGLELKWSKRSRGELVQSFAANEKGGIQSIDAILEWWNQEYKKVGRPIR